jgi:hypothetical protein
MAAQSSAQDDIDALGARAVREGEAWDQLEPERRELAANARLYRGLSIGLGAACLALFGVGATVWIMDEGDGSSVRTGGAGVGYRGQF